ncbi:MAG TPA: hypothetical protein VN796_04460 [Acidimicrobiales bacterium]|nr:hypothetical protein [Acidimicrobiales bacterium]
MARRGRRPRRSWSGFGLIVGAAVATIALLVVVIWHRDAQLPKAGDCPGARVVNAALGTDVSSPTAVGESDLLGCFYPEGTDQQAVSVSFATRRPGDDPCRRRRRLVVSGDEACDVTGTPGTRRSGGSVVVETGDLQDQFSTDLDTVPFDRLEDLAARIVDEVPPPVRGAVGVHLGGAVSQA